MKMKNIKVLHVLNELKYSGAEIMYVAAAPYFQKLNCSLLVMATATNVGEYASQFQNAGYKVTHKPYPNRLNIIARLFYYIQLVKFIKNENVDVVHIHSSKAMWGFSLCAWIAKISSVYTFHNVFPTNWYSNFFHVFLRFTAKHIFNCKFQTISDSVYNNELIRFKNKTTKIYNWYNKDKFYPAKAGEKMNFRNELGLKNDDFVIISIGGCSHIKRHDEIIKALATLKPTISNLIYLHLGTGEIIDNEITLSKELGVYDNIRFIGNTNEVRKYLVASDIYVMPSKHEGMPISVVEVFATGLPTVLYNVPGLSDFNNKQVLTHLINESHIELAKN